MAYSSTLVAPSLLVAALPASRFHGPGFGAFDRSGTRAGRVFALGRLFFRHDRRRLGRRTAIGGHEFHDIGAVFSLAETREAHLGAIGEGARAGQPFVHRFPGPGAALAGQRRAVGEARGVAADRLAHHAIKVRADAVGAALVDRVTRGALGEDFLARRGIRAGKQRAEVGARIGTAFFGCAFDEVARLFRVLGAIGMEIHARNDGAAQCHDTGGKDPACSGVETIVHCVKYPAKIGWSDGCAPL